MRVVVEQVAPSRRMLNEASSLSRQHYQAIANIIKDVVSGEPVGDRPDAIYEIVDGLTDYFKQDNPSFDKDRFKKATGL